MKALAFALGVLCTGILSPAGYDPLSLDYQLVVAPRQLTARESFRCEGRRYVIKYSATCY